MVRRKKTSPMADQTGCRLLGLPAELRNHIYELALSGVTHTIPSHDTNYHRKKKHPAPGLVLTCQQIHAETMSMFYAQATFCIADHWNLAIWLKKIGPVRQQQITTVHYCDPERIRSRLVELHSNSQYRIQRLACEAATSRQRILNEMRNLGAIIDYSKVFVKVSLPGTKVNWTNDPKKVTRKFAEKLREIKKRPGKIENTRAWYEMIRFFR